MVYFFYFVLQKWCMMMCHQNIIPNKGCKRKIGGLGQNQNRKLTNSKLPDFFLIISSLMILGKSSHQVIYKLISTKVFLFKNVSYNEIRLPNPNQIAKPSVSCVPRNHKVWMIKHTHNLNPKFNSISSNTKVPL
jgi:hypothetical protein